MTSLYSAIQGLIATKNRGVEMPKQTCSDCQELLSGKTNNRHANLEKRGLAHSARLHGMRDDEYHYTCKKCGQSFIGDSQGTWPASDE